MPVGELPGGWTDRAEDLLAVALTLGGDAGLRVANRPGRMQGGRLTEGGFVLVDDYGVFRAGVFFRFGTV